MSNDLDLEEKLMQVAFSEVRETSPEIFAKLGRTCRDGEVLFKEGERSTELIMIVSGMCKITKVISGEEKVLAVLKAGEILGEMSHFDDAPRSATARAVGTLNVLSLTRENFGMIFELHHKWTLHLIQQISNRVHGTFQRLVAAHEKTQPAAAGAPPRPAVQANPGLGTKTIPVHLGSPDKVLRFLDDVRAAVRKGGSIQRLRDQAVERLAAEPAHRQRIEQLFEFAMQRLKDEGITG